jgi:acetyl-CoA C-acetyltransferase
VTGHIWVLGGYQSDFARNLAREGRDVADLTTEVVAGTLTDAAVPATAIEVVHVGNAFGQLFTGQGHLGAMPATVEPALWSIPASRHEAACASGSVAVLAAASDLRAGNYDCALVLGAELEKTVPGEAAARHLGAASWVGHEDDAKFVWPHVFNRLAETYDARYGLDDSHLRAIAALNLANARRNPYAQTRSWQVPDLLGPGADDDAANPVVDGRIRRYDCSQVTDGGAGVVLVTDRWLRDHPDVRPRACIEGWGHRTVGLGLSQKLARDADDPYVAPHVRDTFQDALARAQVTLDALDGLEVHDCFTPTEYLAIDHTGITGPGESWKAIESGEIAPGGHIPVNPSGGLIGGGHPVGATGVRMLLDATKQVSGRAGDYQVDGARRFATLNIGGSTATTVSFVIASPPEL